MHNRDKTFCKHGHPYDETNTIKRKDGKGRGCRACLQRWHEQYRARQKALKERPGLKIELVVSD
jgi:hypothetical protein